MTRRLLRGWLLPVALLLGAAPATAAAQEVDLDDFGWLKGTWRGDGPGGAVAEIHYMEPRAGNLPSIFRLRQDGRVVVLEAISLVEEDDGGLVMYVRHFDTALVPLEKERAIALRLVEKRDQSYFFENVNEGQNPRRSVMTRTEDGFTSVSYLSRPDGSTDEIRVSYERVGVDGR